VLDQSESANEQATERIFGARPVLIDIRPAREAIASLGPRTVLHAGPPLPRGYEVSGALRGTVIGAALYEGWATTAAEALELLKAGEIDLRSAQDFNALGTYCGGITPSAPVIVVENAATGTRVFNNLNEGRGKALRYGSYAGDVLERLRWFERTCAPILREMVRRSGGIDVFPLVAQALHMGDECHSRHKAATTLLIAHLAPMIAAMNALPQEAAQVIKFIAGNDVFFLNITMAAAKTALLAAEGVAGSSIVTAMARNGVEFGIRVSGCGQRWFTAPVVPVEGQFFRGYGPEDANPDIGDSAITETLGLGAFSLAAAPALARYMGLTPSRASEVTHEMYKIVCREHPVFTLPQLDYRGAPSCIDVRRVVETGVTPITNSGLAHRDGGTGQIGAGFVRTPLKCFRDAVLALKLAS
jgi:hypothetical protein